ncbi:outer membrane protein assembly factor BamB family protein [Peristeroidobacter soli]|uniref:outer membrane protein assembly factor BamB family protein n=1 Tax=Peristeroidobacter soli TaxID=2497877 RepID=UPI00101CC156|nr:PQQ-binding-like beta-propeller repeat protein [Peristeroidobacter soli]
MPTLGWLRPLFWGLLFGSLTSVGQVRAEEIRDYYAEPGLNPFKESINQHFNEHVDPFSGTLQLKYVDLSIPGNGGMDINVTRVYTSLQTNQYPKLGLNGLGWTMHFGRIVVPRQYQSTLCNQGAFPLTTRENPSLEMPDGGRELLVLNHINNDGSMITRSNWRAQCGPNGVGLTVTSPNGTRYTMNQFDVLHDEPAWLTTRIEDLQGNWIRIAYKTNALGISYIDAVFRSEEGDETPVVRYEYDDEGGAGIRLRAISANGQRVGYLYESIPGFMFDNYYQLTQVVRPDGRSWYYRYNPKLGDPDPNDDVLEDGPASFSLIHVSYPHGAEIDYTYQRVAFDPGDPMQKTTAIQTKTVSGSGVTGGQWTYAFAPFSYPYDDSFGGQLRHDVTTIIGPEDIQKFYHYGKDFRAAGPTGGQVFVRPSFVGLQVMHEIYSTGNALLQRTGYSWTGRRISTEDYWHGAGYRSWWRDDGTYAPMLSGEYVDRDSRAPTEGFNHYKQYFDHDAYGNPGRIVESTNFSDRPSIQTRLTYFIDPAKWIVQLPKDEIRQELGGATPHTVGEIERTFNANGKLLSEVSLGVETKYTYNDAGDIATIEDARGKIRRYSNYKRGVPRLERLPESVTIERVVNDTGTVRSDTNGRGFTTAFQYDELNRLTAIDFPIKADVTIHYDTVGGGYRRTLTRGGYQQSELINDFGQALRTERRDSVTGQEIYRTKRYDASGRQIFVSYPSSAAGIASSYDALGRIVRTERSDGGHVGYVYDDDEVRVTNERGFTTTYNYHVRGIDFASMSLAFVKAPENVGTLIFRNAYENITRVFQGELLSNGSVRGYGKEYEYDEHQFLVRAIEPEVGTTVYTHDPIGNVLSERVNDNEPVLFGYDDLSRRTHTNYPDTTPDEARLYDANNNVREVTKGAAHWVYDYDENDNLTNQTLSIADAVLGVRSYVTANQYDDLDALSRVTYPSGLAVDYAPNAFGRPTRAGTFATNVTWHPGGQLQSYRLANGVVTNVTLSQRMIPETIRAGGLVDLSYSYDLAGNMTAMVDGIDASKSVRMQDAGSYDGLDRLLIANGSWGRAQFAYDFFGNMRSRVVGSDTLNHQMDDQRRLRQVKQMSPTDSTRELARIRMDFDSRGNAVARRQYGFDAGMRVVTVDDKQFSYDAASNLVEARVVSRTPSQTTSVVDKEFVYDGNGQRVVEKKHRSYDIRYSVPAHTGALLFEDSIATCTRTDYIRLGTLTLAKSDDRFANAAVDTDGDGINDCMEVQLGLDPANASDAAADRDGDGLSNLQEFLAGTSLSRADTDNDGVSDYQEMNQYLTDPTLADSDGDGLSDGAEAGNSQLDPALADLDHDGVSDYWELQLGSNPHDPSDARLDADGDGFSNRQESLAGFDPTRAQSTPARGRQAWSFETLGRVMSSAAIGPDGTIYVSADYENLYAIYPDGTQRWRYTVPQASLSAPIVAPNGTIYISAAGATPGIHAINPDGTRRWVHAASNATGVVLGTGGRVYFAAYTISAGPFGISVFGRWSALNEDGQSVAVGSFNDGVTYPPVVAANGNVYVMDASGVMRAFSPGGLQLWSIEGIAEAAAAPVIGPNQKIYFSDTIGRTYAVSPQGEILWTRQSPDQQTRSTITVGGDGTLYIGAYDSKLYAVSDQDGSTLWSAATYGTSYTPTVAADGTIYVTNFGGAISAYSPAGTLLWIHKVDTEVSAPPVIDRDGTLYYGSRTGQLFAVVDNGGGLARTPWPTSRHDSAGSSYQCFDSEAFSIAADRDGDGIDDCAELAYGLDPANPADAAQDPDGDGLTNAQEHAAGTRLNVADSDGDGLNDGQEVLTYHTDPLNADSDRDFISDGQEVQYGLDPRNAADALEDADGDGFSNRQEYWAGTDLRNATSVPTEGAVALQVNDSTMPMRSVALGVDGTIYQNSSTGLEALNPDFSVKWTWPTQIVGHPVIGADGTIYVITARADNAQRVVALFPNGRQRWSYSVAAPSTSVGLYEPPVLGANGTLYFGVRSSDSAGDLILAINSKGRPVWGNGVRFSGRRPKLAIGLNGDVIAHDGASGIRAYDAVSGTQRWVDTTSRGTGTEFSAPSIDSDGTIYISNSAGLHAIAAVSGVRQWTFAGARGEPVITPDGLILQLCGTQRALCAVSRQGVLTWTATETYTFAGTPVIGSNGRIYVATRNNAFASYSSAGVRLSEAMLDSSGDVTYPVILIDGTIYLGPAGQRVLIVSGSSGLADSPWPTRNRDNRNSRNTARIVPVPPSPEPSVVITAPGSGATVNLDVGELLNVSAYAVDMTDGELSAGVEWSSNLEGVLGSGASLSLHSLRAGTHTITATATDSSNLSGSDTFTATVGIVPPTVSITSPTTDAQFERGAAVVLAGTAQDRVDGDLSAAIEWSSSLDGPLGTASTLTVTTLQAGSHTITAKVTDSSGTSTSATVQITVEIIPPNLYIYSPSADGTYEQGTPIYFDAEAYDTADGDLSSSIEWSSDRDGLIGTGAFISSSSLSTGPHVITARVRDSSGAEASQTRNITVALLPPELNINSPWGFVEVMAGEEVYFEASAYDQRDGDLSGSIQWTSPLDGPLHTGSSFSTSSLSVGWHQIRAAVTDSSGLTTTRMVWAIVDSPDNEAPFIVIEAPATNTEIYFTDPLTFSAIGYDPQEGQLNAIQWSSSLQGAIGTGSTITVSNLQVGDHIITALVMDSAGAKAAEEIAVKVLPIPANYPPVVRITSLGLNGFYTVDSTLPLVGTVTDREQGDLSSSIVWSSNIDGELGRGASIRVGNLTAGEHVITATATDGGGVTGRATRTIVINADGQAYHMYDPFDVSVGPDALAGWRVVDNAPIAASVWRVSNGAATELTGTWSGSLTSPAIDKQATYLLQTSGTHWTDYRVNLSISSPDDDSLGLMFRVRDDNNYYRFSMDRERGFRRLVKKVNGVYSTIWQDTWQYVQNQSYQLEVEVVGTTITIRLDGVQLYTGNDPSHLRGSIALYSWGSQGAAFDNVEVENLTTASSNNAPVVTIASPADNASVVEGRNVTFSAISEDAEDGSLSSTIQWSSSVDGALGTGGVLNVSTLSLGTHVITASSTDSGNVTGLATISLTVNQFVNHAPVVTIVSPANGAAYGLGDLIAFSATATDEEDGPLTSSITWSSSINGNLGSTGQISTSTLSTGTHTITARVTDSLGAVHAPTITITVGAARPVLMSNDFTNRSLGGFTIVTDAGTSGGPPVWSASTQAAVQTSQIFGGATTPATIPRLGTYMYWTNGTSWTNYTVEADLRASDPDTLGLMFRYLDNTNYYRFSMDRTLSQRRLVKRVAGTFTVLKEDSVAFNLNQTYRLSISAYNGTITVMIDGQVFYTGTDTGVASGSVAFYCWRNGGATFDNIVVRSLSATPPGARAPEQTFDDTRSGL